MRARPRRLPRGSRRGFLRDGTFSRLCLLWEAVHPIRRHYTLSDRVQRDVTGASRRNGCSASRAALVLQAWSASVTGSGCGRGWAWKPPMLTTPVCASRSYVRQRRSGASPWENKQGRDPSRVARVPPIAVRTRRDHRVGAVMTGARIRCAAWSLTGGMHINAERYQRHALTPHAKAVPR